MADNHNLNEALKVLGPALTETNISLPQKLKKIVTAIRELTQSDGVSIWLREGNQLWCRAGVGHYEKMEKGGANQAVYDLKVPDEDGKYGLTAWIAKKGEPINLSSFDELRNHPQWKGKYDIEGNYPERDSGGKRCESFLGFPLKVDNNVFGVIKADNRKGESGQRGSFSNFSEDDVNLFSLLASVTAIIIKNDQEYQKLQALEKKANGLFNIVTRCIDLDQTDALLWALIVGLTHEEGIGFNRAILFDVVERNDDVTIKGIMANGPKDLQEAQSVYQQMESISNIKANELIDHYLSNNKPPQIELQRYIENISESVSKISFFFDLINKVGPNQVEFFRPKDMDIKNIPSYFEDLRLTAPIIIAFHLPGRGKLVCFCDNLYSKSTALDDELSQRLVMSFVRHIQIAASRVESLLFRDCMASITVHSLKNHIAAMGSCLESIHNAYKLLEIKKLDFAQAKNRISKAADGCMLRLSNIRMLKDNYFAFVRANHRDTFEEVSLREYVKETFALANSIEFIKNIVSIDVPDICVPVPKNALHTTLSNLIQNSIESIRTRGEISVGASIRIGYMRENHVNCLTVEDNGVGIDVDRVKNLFKPRFTTKATGTGMGLYTSKEFMMSQGGDIIYDPKDPGWTRFIIRLPQQAVNGQ